MDVIENLVGIKALPLYSMVKEAVVHANALSFFGRDLGKMASQVTVLKRGTDT